MELTANECVFKIMGKVKQTRVGTHTQPGIFLSPTQRMRSCV